MFLLASPFTPKSEPKFLYPIIERSAGLARAKCELQEEGRKEGRKERSFSNETAFPPSLPSRLVSSRTRSTAMFRLSPVRLPRFRTHGDIRGRGRSVRFVLSQLL